MSHVRRRDFLKYSVIGTGILASGCLFANEHSAKKPNIIYLFTDQQSASMMSCADNKWLKTPGMDTIAKNGIRFTRAYTTNPVCSPARVSLMTGRFAGAFNDNKGNQVRTNDTSMKIPSISQEVANTTLGAFLKKTDYELVYGGKEHLPRPLRATAQGFEDISNDMRGELAETAAEFIRAKHDKPYFLIISLINPHDICYMTSRDFAPPKPKPRKKRAKDTSVEYATLDKALEMPAGISEEEFFEKYCPPLPPNYELQTDEPKAVSTVLVQGHNKRARQEYSDKRWRQHRWAYCRLTEFVDHHIQTILDAVTASGQEEDTLVMFSSDHGEMDAAHRMAHKSALYEETANIPFMAMWKGHIPAGQVNDTHLVSNGLDLLPTVCDYAGIKGVSDPRGRSLRPLFEGKNVPWRNTLGVECKIGRMVVDKDKFKYIQYDAAGIEEQLLNLNEDPYETTHFTNAPQYASKLGELKKAFETEWFPNLPKV